MIHFVQYLIVINLEFSACEIQFIFPVYVITTVTVSTGCSAMTMVEYFITVLPEYKIKVTLAVNRKYHRMFAIVYIYIYSQTSVHERLGS
jgi:hypothetical protein